MALHRAFRFDPPAELLPGRQSRGGLGVSATGKIALVEGAASIRQALMLLISTQPGERVMRPTYGCSLQHLIFGPNDETTAGLVIHYIRRAVETWEPRVELVKLDAAADPEAPEVMLIVLDYRVRATRALDRITYPLSLTGGRR
jgi:phage baseplate assembly protein W